MNPKFVDVLAGLEEAIVEAAKLAEAVKRVSLVPGPDELLEWLLLQGLASAVEKIYTHVESALYKITQHIDEAPLSKDGGWHVNLLTRLHADLPEVRPAVLSRATYLLAKDLCAFRHLERGIYGTDLDRGRVLDRVPGAVQLPHLVRSDVDRLRKEIEKSKPLKCP